MSFKSVCEKLRVGIIGYGRMGRSFVAAMQASELWEVGAVYDICSPARELARQDAPNASVYDHPEAIFADASPVAYRAPWCPR